MAIENDADHEPIQSDGLLELGAVPPARQYLADLWRRREFAIMVPYNDLRAQKMDTALGQLWHLLNPMMQIAVYWFIFGFILKIDRGIDNYVGFLVVGILLFTLTSRIVTDSVGAMKRDEGLIKSIQFPRALLPISSVVEQTMAFVPAAAVLFGALLLTGQMPGWRWLIFPFILALGYLINTGAALMAARAGYAVRDLTQVVTHIFRLLFYLSAVLFEPSRFVEDETLLKLFAINPLYDLIAVSRWSLVYLEDVGIEPVIGLVVWATILPVLGFRWFVRAEHRYGS